MTQPCQGLITMNPSNSLNQPITPYVSRRRHPGYPCLPMVLDKPIAHPTTCLCQRLIFTSPSILTINLVMQYMTILYYPSQPWPPMVPIEPHNPTTSRAWISKPSQPSTPCSHIIYADTMLSRLSTPTNGPNRAIPAHHKLPCLRVHPLTPSLIPNCAHHVEINDMMASEQQRTDDDSFQAISALKTSPSLRAWNTKPSHAFPTNTQLIHARTNPSMSNNRPLLRLDVPPNENGVPLLLKTLIWKGKD